MRDVTLKKLIEAHQVCNTTGGKPTTWACPYKIHPIIDNVTIPVISDQWCNNYPGVPYKIHPLINDVTIPVMSDQWCNNDVTTTQACPYKIHPLINDVTIWEFCTTWRNVESTATEHRAFLTSSIWSNNLVSCITPSHSARSSPIMFHSKFINVRLQ